MRPVLPKPGQQQPLLVVGGVPGMSVAPLAVQVKVACARCDVELTMWPKTVALAHRDHAPIVCFPCAKVLAHPDAVILSVSDVSNPDAAPTA